MRALRFLVFFDIGVKAIGEKDANPNDSGRSPKVIVGGIGLTVLARVRAHVCNAVIFPGLSELGSLTTHGRYLTNPRVWGLNTGRGRLS